MVKHLNVALASGICFAATLFAESASRAHEGHAPLPTRGAEVDLQTGRIILSAQAREALDVQTSEVDLRRAEKRVPAYARLSAPWDQHAFVTTRVSGRISAAAGRGPKKGPTVPSARKVRCCEIAKLAQPKPTDPRHPTSE